MPSRAELVTESIGRLDTAGVRSQLVELDTVTLHDLCLRITDRAVKIAEAHKWLNTELGGDDANQIVDDNAVYRFAANYRPIYDQVRAEHARRVARLSVEHATAGNVEAMHRVGMTRLVDLVTEKLVETNNIEDLSGNELGAMIATLQGITKANIKREELALKAAESEQRVAKLEAESALLRQRLDGLPDKIKAITAKLEKIETAQQRGDAVSPRLFTSIREQLAALAYEPAESGEGGAA